MGSWSVVVWATVTGDLKEAYDADIREARQALRGLGAGDDVHVHVIRTGPGAAAALTDLPETATDSAPGSTLGEVLAATQCWQEGSRRRLLVFWGHGARAFPTAHGTIDLGSDVLSEATQQVLGPDVPDAIRVSRAFEPGAGPSLRPPHIIGYDACRMASVTTVLTLAECFPTALFIGSMVPEPASGWPYSELVRILRDSLDPTGADDDDKPVAAALVEAYAASVEVADWCLVALDLAKIGTGAADGTLAAVMARLRSSPPPDPVDFFAAAQGADILDDTNLADLGALMRRLDLDGPGPARDVRTAIHAATVARRAGGSLGGRDGVSVRVGLPWGPRDPRDPEWPQPPAMPGWGEFLPDVAAHPAADLG